MPGLFFVRHLFFFPTRFPFASVPLKATHFCGEEHTPDEIY